jgi:hypothetical protein
MRPNRQGALSDLLTSAIAQGRYLDLYDPADIPLPRSLLGQSEYAVERYRKMVQEHGNGQAYNSLLAIRGPVPPDGR